MLGITSSHKFKLPAWPSLRASLSWESVFYFEMIPISFVHVLCPLSPPPEHNNKCFVQKTALIDFKNIDPWIHEWIISGPAVILPLIRLWLLCAAGALLPCESYNPGLNYPAGHRRPLFSQASFAEKKSWIIKAKTVVLATKKTKISAVSCIRPRLVPRNLSSLWTARLRSPPSSSSSALVFPWLRMSAACWFSLFCLPSPLELWSMLLATGSSAWAQMNAWTQAHIQTHTRSHGRRLTSSIAAFSEI